MTAVPSSMSWHLTRDHAERDEAVETEDVRHPRRREPRRRDVAEVVDQSAEGIVARRLSEEDPDAHPGHAQISCSADISEDRRRLSCGHDVGGVRREERTGDDGGVGRGLHLRDVGGVVAVQRTELLVAERSDLAHQAHEPPLAVTSSAHGGDRRLDVREAQTAERVAVLVAPELAGLVTDLEERDARRRACPW